MADLARLTNLHFLNFNQSDHAMLLASFHNLTRVDVQYPQQSELIELLQSNSNLRHLDLGKLYDFAGMQNISHLTSLSIGLFLNDSTDSAKTLEHAHRLKHLRIWFAQQRSIQLPLHTLTALKSLILTAPSSQVVESLTGLAHLNLEELSISGCITADVTRRWTSLTSLKKLSLELDFAGQSQNVLGFLTALSSLSEFLLRHHNSDSNCCIQLLPDTLTKLEIEVNAFHITTFTRLTALQQLIISDYDQAPLEYYFLTSLTHLTQLQVYTNSIRNCLLCIEQMTNLRSIKIHSYNDLLESRDFNFSNLVNLEMLDLPYIASATWATLSALTKLTHLESVLGTRYIPHVLERLPLKKLRVIHNHNAEFWQSLTRISTMESLRVDHAASVDEIISLSNLQNLTELEVSVDAPIRYKCFTRLTSLQRLTFCVGLDETRGIELMNTMPYLCYVKLK